MVRKDVESCGRCSMSTVVDAVNDGSDPEAIQRTVYGDSVIEVDEADLKRVNPHLVLSDRLQRWLNEIGMKVIFGR